MAERDTDTCHGHDHLAIQIVHYENRPLGEIIVSSSVEEAEIVARNLIASGNALAIFGSEHTVWLN